MKKNETDLRIESKFALQNVMVRFGYEKMGIEFHNGRSFIYDCSFYKTEFEKVFITDYDISNDLPLNDKTAIVFSRKTGKHVKVTIEFMEQAERFFKAELEKLNAP